MIYDIMPDDSEIEFYVLGSISSINELTSPSLGKNASVDSAVFPCKHVRIRNGGTQKVRFTLGSANVLLNIMRDKRNNNNNKPRVMTTNSLF